VKEAEQKAATEQQKMQMDGQVKAIDAQGKQAEYQAKLQLIDAQGKREAQKHEQEMRKGAIELRMKEIELAALQTPEQTAETQAKPPSESIAFKDLPPEGQAQMAAQAGITLSPQQMADHQAEQDAKKQAEMAVKAKQQPKVTA
jgi:hypothetical protein